MFVNFETTGHHSIRFNPNLYNDGKVTQQRKSRLTEELRILTVAAQIIISFFFFFNSRAALVTRIFVCFLYS